MAASSHALDDLPGGLALTEAGDLDAAAALAVRSLQTGLEFLFADLDDQFDFIFFFVFDYALDIHVLFLL